MVKASVVAAAADVADQDVEVGMFEVSKLVSFHFASSRSGERSIISSFAETITSHYFK